MRLLSPFTAALCLLGAFLLTGCARTSPAVGTWTAQSGPFSATVVLNEDGTGTLTPPPVAGGPQPVKWELNETTVTMTVGGGPAAGGKQRPSANMTGTLSEDKKTMEVATGLPMLQKLTFQKQAESK